MLTCKGVIPSPMNNVASAAASLTASGIAERKLRVLLVADSIHWITGTIAKSIADHSDWMDGTIVSGAVLDVIARANPELFSAFDVVHFLC